MKTRTKSIFAGLALTGIFFAAGFVWISHSEHADVQAQHAVVQAQEAEYNRMLADLRQALPAGSSHKKVISVLRERGLLQSDPGVEETLWISVGKEHSFVWYCGPVDAGLRFSFEASVIGSEPQRLLGIERETRALDCL